MKTTVFDFQQIVNSFGYSNNTNGNGTLSFGSRSNCDRVFLSIFESKNPVLESVHALTSKLGIKSVTNRD